MTAELSNTNQLTADEMTVDTDASHTTPRHLTFSETRLFEFAATRFSLRTIDE